VPFTLTLDLDFASISSPEEYKTEFIKDIAFASKTAEVFFKFAGLRAGSIINEMLVAPGGGNPDSIIQGLIEQLGDPSSCLMQGKWTSKSIAIDPATKLGSSVLSDPSEVVGQVKSAHDNHEAPEVSRIQNAKGPEKNHGMEKGMVPQDSSNYSSQSVRAAKALIDTGLSAEHLRSISPHDGLLPRSPTEEEQETAARAPEQGGQSEMDPVQAGLTVGARVEIHSLLAAARAPELNGVHGEIVVPLDSSTDRWGVKTDTDSRVWSLRPDNLRRLEAHGHASPASPGLMRIACTAYAARSPDELR
jgi:hypothetical protein